MPLLWGTAAFLSFDCASTQLAFILYPVWKIIYKITKPIYGTKESEKILHTVFKKVCSIFDSAVESYLIVEFCLFQNRNIMFFKSQPIFNFYKKKNRIY